MTNERALLIGGALGVVALAVLSKLPRLSADALNALSPFNRDNVFYSGVNNAGAALTSDPYFNLGSDVLFPLFNPGARAAEREALSASMAPVIAPASAIDAAIAAAPADNDPWQSTW